MSVGVDGLEDVRRRLDHLVGGPQAVALMDEDLVAVDVHDKVGDGLTALVSSVDWRARRRSPR